MKVCKETKRLAVFLFVVTFMFSIITKLNGYKIDKLYIILSNIRTHGLPIFLICTVGLHL